MRTVNVDLGDRSYRISIGSGLLDHLGSFCSDLPLKGRAAVVTNTTIAPLYLQRVVATLEACGYAVTTIVIPDGEEYKNSATLDTIYDALISAGLDRGAFIVALGGGVVGDMAGFAAATFLRGVPFVQVPTTLLAQVDSSVGGKTGINHRLGKNLIGAFYQPEAVVIDLDTLDTLPEREYRCGLAETIKYGVVLDRQFFEYIDANAAELHGRNKTALEEIIAVSCSIKASVVAQDERESGLRAVLNFGHTIGHAVETLSGYGQVKHGEAVGIGMAQIARISCLQGLCTPAERDRIIGLIARFGLSVDLPEFPLEKYREIIEHDKKKRDDGVNFIFNRGIGDFVMTMITDIPALLTDSGAATGENP